MIFSVRTRWIHPDFVDSYPLDKLVDLTFFACDYPAEPDEVTYMSNREGRCVLERGHHGDEDIAWASHTCDGPGGRGRQSWRLMTDEEWAEAEAERAKRQRRVEVED